MVESLKELNQLCQKPNYKEVGNWMVRRMLRDAALPMTWLLLHTHVTANQVTFVSLIFGLAGAIFFTFLSPVFFLAGALCLQFWYYLDHVDGQIARYRKTASLSGRFHDFIVHHIIHGMIIFCLGFYVFRVTELIFTIALGFIGSMGIMMFNLISDVKCKTFIERLLSCDSVQILHTEAGPKSVRSHELQRPFLKVFSFFHKAIEIHVLMNTLAFAAVIQIFLWRSLDTRFWLFFFYSLMAPFLATIKLTYVIWLKKIDQEFNGQFRTNV